MNIIKHGLLFFFVLSAIKPSYSTDAIYKRPITRDYGTLIDRFSVQPIGQPSVFSNSISPNKLTDNINQAAQAIGNITQAEFEKFCGEIVGDIISGKLLYAGLGKTIQCGRTAIKVGNTPKPATVFTAAKKLPARIPQLNKPAPIDFRFNPATNAYEIAPELPTVTQSAKAASSVVPPGNQSLPHAPQKPKLLPTSAVPSSSMAPSSAKLVGAVKATSALPTGNKPPLSQAPVKTTGPALPTSSVSAKTASTMQDSAKLVSPAKAAAATATSSAEIEQAAGKSKSQLSHAEALTKCLPMTEEMALKAWAEYPEYQSFMKRVEELKKIVPDTRYVQNVEVTLEQWAKTEAKAKDLFEQIRQNSNDIALISKNTGITEDVLTKIKSHIFYEEHVLKLSTKLFDADLDMAEAWGRLVQGNFVQSDLLWLQHELAESIIMRGKIVSYDIAHAIVDKYFDWASIIRGTK